MQTDSEIAQDVSPQRAANKLKFELEIETVQSFANPHYLLELAATGHLDSEPFLNFVDYLAYWEKPEFARFLVYPQCLHHRRLLLQPRFRAALKSNGPELVAKLSAAQFSHWSTWRTNSAAVLASAEGVKSEVKAEVTAS